MPIRIFCNTIPIPEYAQAFEKAVLSGLKGRPESEQWRVSIVAPADSSDYFVTLTRIDLPGSPGIGPIHFIRPGQDKSDLVEVRIRRNAEELANQYSTPVPLSRLKSLVDGKGIRLEDVRFWPMYFEEKISDREPLFRAVGFSELPVGWDPLDYWPEIQGVMYEYDRKKQEWIPQG